MRRVLHTLIIGLILISAFSGLTIAQENNTTNTTTENPIDTRTTEYEVAHVTIHSTKWTDTSLILEVSGLRTDTIQITEYHNNRLYWETYRVGDGPVRIEHQFRQPNADEVAFSVISAKEGIGLTNPTANPITFSRSAQWSDHWYTGSAAVSMVFMFVLYRYKRNQYLSKTHLRSLISGRAYRANDEPSGRVGRVKGFIIKHFYSPRSLLIVVISVLLVEVATGVVFSRFANLQTELKLALLVAILGTPAYWYIAGRILRLMPGTDQPKMLTVDNRETGGLDLLTGAKELFESMRIKGADSLHKKPVSGTNEKVYVAHHYEVATHTVVATWHQILDAVEVMKNYTAAFTNYYLLETEIDEAREIKSAQPALRQKYQQEAQAVAMQRMDETHFDSQASTNDVLADVVDSIEHDDEPSTVDTETPTNSEESETDADPEGDDDE